MGGAAETGTESVVGVQFGVDAILVSWIIRGSGRGHGFAPVQSTGTPTAERDEDQTGTDQEHERRNEIGHSIETGIGRGRQDAFPVHGLVMVDDLLAGLSVGEHPTEIIFHILRGSGVMLAEGLPPAARRDQLLLDFLCDLFPAVCRPVNL